MAGEPPSPQHTARCAAQSCREHRRPCPAGLTAGYGLTVVPTRSTELRRASFRVVFLPAFLFFAVISCLWALASPIFSIPDENAHATKAIALLRGEAIGHRVPGERQLVVDLPPQYSYSSDLVCFVFNPNATADCGIELGSKTGSTSFPSWVSSYNPVYYEIVGWPSLILGGSAGIYAMRIISSLVSAALIGWVFQAALSRRHTRWLPAGLVFLFSPMIVYFAGSVNPQGLEITAAAALWVSLLRLLQTFTTADQRSLPRGYLWTMVVVSAGLLATVRALGPLWVVIIVGGCLLYTGRARAIALFSRSRSYLPIALIALAGIFSLLWTIGGGSLSGQARAGDAPAVGVSFVTGIWLTLRTTPAYFEQAAGVFGWQDTYLPAAVNISFGAALILLTVLALTAVGGRASIVLAGAIAGAVAIPALVQGYSAHQTGLIWQGRYGLFLYIAIPLLAALLLSGREGARVAFLSVRFTVVIALLTGVYSVFAFLLVLRRYVVGVDTPITHMVSAPHWQPPFGWILLCALFGIVMVAFTAWIIRLAVISGSEPVEGTAALADSGTRSALPR